MTTPAVELSGITKRYPGVVANDAVDLQVAEQILRVENANYVIGGFSDHRHTGVPGFEQLATRVFQRCVRPQADHVRSRRHHLRHVLVPQFHHAVDHRTGRGLDISSSLPLIHHTANLVAQVGEISGDRFGTTSDPVTEAIELLDDHRHRCQDHCHQAEDSPTADQEPLAPHPPDSPRQNHRSRQQGRHRRNDHSHPRPAPPVSRHRPPPDNTHGSSRNQAQREQAVDSQLHPFPSSQDDPEQLGPPPFTADRLQATARKRPQAAVSHGHQRHQGQQAAPRHQQSELFIHSSTLAETSSNSSNSASRRRICTR